ncbi:MAG: hypothetical protein V7719_07445 [Psychroserpens sp.]|uniref:hypothetical protein n=1 Tax=Psychroserpens sp. TaxID=2020870 RepID=UPI003002FC6A
MSESQTVKGFIYDAGTTVKGAKLINKTQSILTYSDGKGYFKIEAKLNDTLVVSSYFHSDQTITLTQKYFDQEVVIELKKITNELDQVEITKVKEKVFDSTAFQSNRDPKAPRIPKAPLLRSGSGLQPTLDLIAVAKFIGKLFKKKKTEIPIIKSLDYVRLFKSSSFFNQKMLRDEFHVSEVHEYLFFEYLAAQQISPSLLSKSNEFALLDTLLIHSKDFGQLLLEYKKE